MAQLNECGTHPITEEKLREMCCKIGENNTPNLDHIPNGALKIVVKARPDLVTFEVYLKKRIFPAQWEKQKLALFPNPTWRYSIISFEKKTMACRRGRMGFGASILWWMQQA